MAGMQKSIPNIALIANGRGAHARSFCEGAADDIRNRCGWKLRLLLRDDLRPTTSLRAFDGVIVRDIGEREYDLICKLGIPVVEAAVKGTGSSRFASVDCDEKELSALAARHFLERGFTEFAFCGYRGVSFSDIREHHFNAAVAAAGFEVRNFPEQGAAFAEKTVEDAEPDETNLDLWVRSLPKGTGVFCANDLLAHKLLAVCQAGRLRIPQDIAILGADNDFLLCNINEPTLSSISLNAYGIGAGAARLLERILAGEIPGDVGSVHESVPPGRLKTRDSTAIYRFGPPWLSDALVYIDRNAAKISAADVCHSVRKSHTAVDAAFAEFLHTSVQKRITSVKMDEALRLLEDGNDRISDIAERLGFPSVQYFGNVFKLMFNATPAAYRKEKRGLKNHSKG